MFVTLKTSILFHILYKINFNINYEVRDGYNIYYKVSSYYNIYIIQDTEELDPWKKCIH